MLEKILLENTYVNIIVTCIVYIIFILMLIKISNKVINSISNKMDKNAIHWKFLKHLVRMVLIVLCILGICMEIPFTRNLGSTIVTSSAVLIGAIGLASQDSLSNIMSGMFISIFKPFAVGDRVKLISIGLVGKIEGINLRHTIIITPENNRIIVPNNVMNKEIVENSNFKDERICNFLDIKISYGSNIEKAIEIIEDVVGCHSLGIDWRSDEEREKDVPKIRVYVRDIINNCVELRVGVWTKNVGDNFIMCSDVRQEILNRMLINNIQLGQEIKIEGGTSLNH